MLQNEGLDDIKKTVCDKCIRFYIPQEDGGGEEDCDGLFVACEPVFFFFKVYMYTPFSDSKESPIVFVG